MNFNQLAMDLTQRPARRKLSELIDSMRIIQLSGPVDVGVDHITGDSRQVGKRSLFVALEGGHVDGHQFVQVAIEMGASVVVVQARQFESGLAGLLNPAFLQHHQTALLVVEDTRRAFAHLADRFYESPAGKLRLIGLTGTNGKTTTSYLIKSILEQAGEHVGLIGTVGYQIGDRRYDAPLTTPMPDTLHRLFDEMTSNGCSTVVMEVSSHALALRRIDGLTYEVSVFTNLTQDHLDFHQSMEEYLRAKKLLFDEYTDAASVFNGDDEAAARMSSGTRARKIFYGFAQTNDIQIHRLELTVSHSRMVIHTPSAVVQITSPLLGRFNAYNVAAAVSAAIALRIDTTQIQRGIELVRTVPGRFEKITATTGHTAIVDYSHTPDSLKKCLEAIRDIFAVSAVRGKIHTVFGCGGERDTGKRPLMGAIAEELSDQVIVTSDNPRSEPPRDIIRDIVSGMHHPSRAIVEPERAAAIHMALESAAPEDVVLVAGKGHETYQIVGNERCHFDDREVIQDWFKRHGGGVRE